MDDIMTTSEGINTILDSGRITRARFYIDSTNLEDELFAIGQSLSRKFYDFVLEPAEENEQYLEVDISAAKMPQFLTGEDNEEVEVIEPREEFEEPSAAASYIDLIENKVNDMNYAFERADLPNELPVLGQLAIKYQWIIGSEADLEAQEYRVKGKPLDEINKQRQMGGLGQLLSQLGMQGGPGGPGGPEHPGA
jgi:hypothetical protein